MLTWHPHQSDKKSECSHKSETEEVRKLLEASFIREVYYPDWLVNVVMVKKANR